MNKEKGGTVFPLNEPCYWQDVYQDSDGNITYTYYGTSDAKLFKGEVLPADEWFGDERSGFRHYTQKTIVQSKLESK